jgi:hypothetical protein
MITSVRTVKTIPGKFPGAVEWAKDIATIVKRVAGVDLTVGTSFGGVVGEIAWISTAKNMTEVEETLAKVVADHDYQNALKKAEHLVVPGSGQQHYWKSF